MAQLYPPDNGKGPATFRRWYLDDVTGFMVPENRATRDDEGRLRDADDLDDTGRDDMHFDTPMERTDVEEGLE